MMALQSILVVGAVALLFGLVGCSGSSSPAVQKDVTCIPEAKLNGIIGGTRVSEEQALSKKVVFLLSFEASGTSICTGTPIAKNVILTAAHCVRGVDPEDITVNFHSALTCESGYNKNTDGVKADLILAHEDYKGTTKSPGDIALVRLASAIPSEYEISPLYNGAAKLSSDRVTLIGYGLTSELREDSGILRTTEKSYKEHVSVVSGILKVKQPTSGICQGDSGGPIYFNVNGQQQIAGVASYVTGSSWRASEVCHNESSFTYVPFYLTWIEKNLKALE